MKYLKNFEAKNPTYKVGDFIIAHTLYFIDEELKYFLYNNIGEIVENGTTPGGQIKKTPTKYYIIKYENIPEELKRDYFKKWSNAISDGNCYYTLHTNDFSLATPEQIARAKYNL